MFRCVHILSDGTVKELAFSTAGGLEDDALQKYCREYFQPPDLKIQRDAIEQALKQQGTDPSSIDERLLQHYGDIRVEIKTLAPPSPINAYIGVSMYCDANAGPHNAILNDRASNIAIRCGYPSPIYGDVFISRVFDNEDMEWTRKDFLVSDLASDAPWLTQAEAINRGKNMNSFTTSGTLSNLSNTSENKSSSHNSLLQWSQTSEDIEIKVFFPLKYATKDVRVVVKPTQLKLAFPSILGSEEDRELRKLQEPDGMELFGKVKVDESGWSIDSEGGRRCLSITLTKAAEGLRWLTLLR